MKILIGSDGTKPEAAPVLAAAARPWPSGSSFCLLNVFSPYPFTAAPIIQQKLKNKVLQNLEAAAQPLRNAGWDATIEIYPGNARRDLNRVAKEWGADLVMVGCNDLNDFTRLLLGSTAQVVVRHAPCSVEVVRPDGGTRFPAGQEFSSRRMDRNSRSLPFVLWRIVRGLRTAW